MYDTNPKEKDKMPPLVVLGVTGPLGSGCTTVTTQIFDDPNRGQIDQLLKALRFVDWIKITKESQISVDWAKFNTSVDDIYKQLAPLSKTMNSPTEESRLKEKELRRKLNDMLELREATKALDYLNLYYKNGRKLFRTLSVSDLIVFHTFMAVEDEKFDINDIDDKYRNFAEIALAYVNNEKLKSAPKGAGFEGYKDYYEKCSNLKGESKIVKLSEAFDSVYGATNKVKNRFKKEMPYKYSEVMQDFGDNIRRCGEPFANKLTRLPDSSYKLAEGIAQNIYMLYESGRSAFFVIDCLRNPYEVLYLRKKFANFFLLSLYADKETRKQRIIDKAKGEFARNLTESQKAPIIRSFEEADKRDSGKNINVNRVEELLYKQNVTKCVQISDIAINNNAKWEPTNKEVALDVCKKNLRILCLILSPGCTKPNLHEMFMNLSYTMAVKSNCISRQVGAVIVSPEGYVVGCGYNDVSEGRISCGLRAIRDLAAEEVLDPIAEAIKKEKETNETLNERLTERFKKSNNDERKQQMCFCLKDILAKQKISPELKDAVSGLFGASGKQNAQKIPHDMFDPFIEAVVEKSSLHQLEYCLALHAEENAILQSAAVGQVGLKGGTIYVTCQPCPICAKKIQKVGIRKVVYTEAYPASLSDIYLEGIDLEQFEGVKPRAYIKLFMPHHDQKEWQYLETQDLVPNI